jgi:hypothetical protein
VDGEDAIVRRYCIQHFKPVLGDMAAFKADANSTWKASSPSGPMMPTTRAQNGSKILNKRYSRGDGRAELFERYLRIDTVRRFAKEGEQAITGSLKSSCGRRPSCRLGIAIFLPCDSRISE